MTRDASASIDVDARVLEGCTMNIAQACTVAGVSRRTIYNWLQAGKVVYRRTAGGAIRIHPESLWQHGWRRGAAPITRIEQPADGGPLRIVCADEASA